MAMCDKDLHALVLEGEPSLEELASAWEAIVTEYTSSVGSTESRIYISLFKDVTRARWTLETIEQLVDVLKKYYAEPLATQLNKLLNADLKFDPENEEEYHRTLKRALSMSKGIKMHLDLKEKQLEVMEQGMSKGETMSREYFENALIAISDHAGYALTDRIMVSEFCTRLNRYTKYCEQQKVK